jgi:ribosomal-protein-alanine N-acetyltransferase
MGRGLVNVRELEPADARGLHELLTDPSVSEHLAAPPPSPASFAGFIEWARSERTAGRAACFGIVPSGLNQAVGLIQIRALEPSLFTAEWGFALGEAFWGTGVFLDAATLVVEFAFDTMRVHRLEARAVDKNGRGNGALQKLGARPEGTLASSFKREGRYATQILWGLDVQDFRDRPLVREPFSCDDAKARISQAIAQVQDRIRAQKPAKPGDAPADYPFFPTGL